MKIYSFECEPCCFVIECKSKKEVREIAKTHMEDKHKKKLADSEINGKITKTENSDDWSFWG